MTTKTEYRNKIVNYAESAYTTIDDINDCICKLSTRWEVIEVFKSICEDLNKDFLELTLGDVLVGGVHDNCMDLYCITVLYNRIGKNIKDITAEELIRDYDFENSFGIFD